jgi:excinuclease ABC subunit A
MAFDSGDILRVRGAHEHNLRHVSVDLPRDSLIVVTGLSGSGKSSFAFDTIYAEGQRRYMESLSSYARQFLDQMPRPKVDEISGLSPAISIEQKTVSRNPRSTVGTVTEIYDFLRVLFANIGVPHCPQCGTPVQSQTADRISETILSLPPASKVLILAPIVRDRKGEYRQEMSDALRMGYTRARVDGKMVSLEEGIPVLKRSYKHDISIVIDRIVVSPTAEARIRGAVETALRMADGLVEIQDNDSGLVRLLSRKFACSSCGSNLDEITHRIFSYNSPAGACPSCEGIGTVMQGDPDLIVPDPSLTIQQGALAPLINDKLAGHAVCELVKVVMTQFKISPHVPWKDLSEEARKILLYGTREPIELHRLNSRKSTFVRKTTWEGLLQAAATRYKVNEEEAWLPYLREVTCKDCRGTRLKPAGLSVRIAGRNIAEVAAMDVSEAMEFLEGLQLTDREQKISSILMKEIGDRLRFLNLVGLGYLSLDRRASTLSGGEAQRIRLATQIGSQLTGVLYVLDEPSIGLHPSDNDRLLESLHHLRDLGNTLVVVEHDEATMLAADWLVDLGPGAGSRGGRLMASAPPKRVVEEGRSLTAQYLRGERRIEVPSTRRTWDPSRVITIRGARENNLRNVDATFPLGVLTVVCGISGSGKSTLVHDILLSGLQFHLHGSAVKVGRHDRIEGLDLVDKVIEVDQSPIGRTPRSNPATYIGVFTAIRDLFASLPESEVRGYKPGRFSFNTAGGRCEACGGDGLIRVEMHFLPDVHVECEACRGKRYNQETLQVVYGGKTIADVLAMTVDEAVEFFAHNRTIAPKLKVLQDVGLGYITLGQSSTTLSGGEAQRIKLTKELGKRGTGRTIYILDEPTTGLHFEDIRHLLSLLQGLVNAGNTVIVIEHNLDVIKSADYVLDMGPGGGRFGGKIVAHGTPEEVAANPASVTGRYIAKSLGLPSIPAAAKQEPSVPGKARKNASKPTDLSSAKTATGTQALEREGSPTGRKKSVPAGG